MAEPSNSENEEIEKPSSAVKVENETKSGEENPSIPGSEEKSGFVYRTKRLFVIERPDKQSLSQFVSDLQAEVGLIEASGMHQPAVASKKTVLEKLKKDLDSLAQQCEDNDNWHKAFAAEQIITGLYPHERVMIELARRSREADRQRAPFASFYETKIADIEHDFRAIRKNQLTSQEVATEINRDDAQTSIKTQARQMLLALSRDLHWHYQQKLLKTEHARDAMYRVFIVFLLAFLFFLVTLFTMHKAFSSPGKSTTANNSSSQSVEQEQQ